VIKQVVKDQGHKVNGNILFDVTIISHPKSTTHIAYTSKLKGKDHQVSH